MRFPTLATLPDDLLHGGHGGAGRWPAPAPLAGRHVSLNRRRRAGQKKNHACSSRPCPLPPQKTHVPAAAAVGEAVGGGQVGGWWGGGAPGGVGVVAVVGHGVRGQAVCAGQLAGSEA